MRLKKAGIHLRPSGEFITCSVMAVLVSPGEMPNSLMEVASESVSRITAALAQA
jgi:hypothetical protein